MIPTQPLTAIAVSAGNILMQHYNSTIEVLKKTDNSPVTQADIAANTYIVEALRQLTPNIPVVAEENAEAANAAVQGAAHFWLVDPLDGTKGFIRKSGEFTVNIGLIRQGVPVAGVVYVPVTEELYYAGENAPAYKQVRNASPQPIYATTPDDEGMVVVASLSHRTPETDAYISTVKVKSFMAAASSLKFCLLAEGKADLYPRFGRTMEWDTAAGDAVLRAAGGKVETLDGTPLTYGKAGFENPYFIAQGKTA